MRVVMPQAGAGAGSAALQLSAVAGPSTAPEDVLHTINLVSQILAMSSISVFMGLRLLTKTMVAPPLHTEDWLAMVSWILSLGYGVTGLLMGHFGGGYHASTVSAERYKSFKKGVYSATVVFSPCSYFTKLALLWIIVRVFRLHRRTIVSTYALVGFLTMYSVTVSFLKAFICRPVEGYWDRAVSSSCYNQRAILVADTAVSALTDLMLLCLPVPVAVSLRMSWSRRLKVAAMLGSGGVATTASLVRLVLVVKFQKSHDETVDFVRFNLLGTAEVSIGLLCACLPAINILLTRVFGRFPDSSDNTGASSRVIELKFLRGSRLRTQHLTADEAAPALAPAPPSPWPAAPELMPEASAKSAAAASSGDVRGPGGVPVHDVTEVPAELDGDIIRIETEEATPRPSDQP